MHQYIFLTILFPLAGFLINSLFTLTNFLGWRTKERETLVGLFSSLMIAIPFGITVAIFLEMLGEAERPAHLVEVYQWIGAGLMNVAIAYQVDTLSVLMALIVTGVGALIHIYSIGYMHGDDGFSRFFSYLNLFIFAMMNLILGANMVVMFLGWEGVGLCSYLLIGFWYDRKFAGTAIASTGDAAKKAFITNRVGDFAMLGAMFLIFQTLGSLNYADIIAKRDAFDGTTVFWITLLIFIGCTGKSAQLPLFVWLPDAMAGPTPVSALIHAATMVTSGIYITARLSPLFLMAPQTMEIIAVVGAITAIFAGTVGLVQNDIKKVLAYSTVSQLGFMFLALGVGAFQIAIFHVMTHAFFKACLFLGSGSVIHAMHEEQDIRKMGGLRKYMPSTSTTFFIASLALAGFPLTAGFFSKDAILAEAFASGHTALYVTGTIAAFCTAFYSMRLCVLTFLGEERFNKSAAPATSSVAEHESGDDHGHDAHGDHGHDDAHSAHGHAIHPHESPAFMTVPLWILAALSLGAGFLGLPAVVTEHSWIHGWLESSVMQAEEAHHLSHEAEWVLLGIGSLVAILGLGFGYFVYAMRVEIAASAKRSLAFLYTTLLDKYYIDELYELLFVRPVQWLSDKVFFRFDTSVIDGTVNGVGDIFMSLGNGLRKWQSGIAQNYAVAITLGLILVIAFIAFR